MDNKITPESVLERGVENILPSKKGLLSLMKKRRITVYQGFDPTSPNLHIGHLIGVRKLAQFQKLGHKVIFLVGDFTGMIGDPSDKSSARKMLTKEKVLENLKGYKKQVEKVIDFNGKNPAEIRFNSTWLAKLSFEDIIELSSHFTVQQMIERDMFQARLKEGKPIYLHEFLYPLMQGYDSVVMDVDLEIGGNDQLFNMMAGRTLMKLIKKKEKYVLTMKLLTAPGGKKMGKTEGNAINLTDQSTDIFGKIMALPDNVLPIAFELLTDLPLNLIGKIGPLEAKKRLAEEVVSQIRSKKEAKEAKEEFEKTFQKRLLPTKIKTVKIGKRPSTILEILLKTGLVDSKSQAKRLILQGAVELDGIKIQEIKKEVDIQTNGSILRVGKKDFVRLINK